MSADSKQELIGKQIPDNYYRFSIVVVLVMACIVRIIHIADTPGWFRDEGTYYAVCESIVVDGKALLGPLNITFCSPFMTHPPFYFYSGAGWLSVWGVSFGGLRIFNIILSLITLGLLLWFIERYLDRCSALLGGIIFTLHPDIIVFNRMIFPYNLYMLLGFIALFLAVEYIHTGRYVYILSTCIITTFALLTVYYALILVVLAGVAILYKRRLLHLPCLLIPIVTFALFFLYKHLQRESGFAEDFLALRRAAVSGSPLLMFQHYLDFFLMSTLTFLGTIGLFFISRPLIRRTIFLSLVIVLYPVMQKADTIIQYVNYPIIPIIPLLVIGEAALVRYVIIARKRIAGGLKPATIVAGFLVVFMLMTGFWNNTSHGFILNLTSPLRFAMIKNTDDARQAAKLINGETSEQELVVASYNIWHLLKCKKTNIPIALSYQGIQSDFFMYRLSHERFLYSPEIQGARFAIIDFISSQMAKAPPGSIHYPVREVVERIRSTWIKRQSFGEFIIYENPQARFGAIHE